MMKRFRRGLNVAFCGFFIDLAVLCWLLGSAANHAQFLMALVVGTLGALLSIAVGVYAGARMSVPLTGQRSSQVMIRRVSSSIHQPRCAQFMRDAGLIRNK